jgi:hypothetical protein
MRKGWLVLLLTILVGRLGFAGVIYEVDVKDHTQSPPQVETTQMRIEGRRLKVEMAPGSHHRAPGEMIYRGDRREMLVIDHNRKSYMVIDQKTVESMGQQYKQAMSQVQEMLKNAPESQRAMLEKMMKEQMPQMSAQQPGSPQSELRQTGERAVKAGYACVKYEIWQEDHKHLEFWVTDWDKVEGGQEVKPVFEEMAAFFKEMLENFGGAGHAPGNFGSSFFAYLDQVDGFPVLSGEFKNGSLVRESILRSAKRQTLNPTAFEPPATYQQSKMLKGQ